MLIGVVLLLLAAGAMFQRATVVQMDLADCVAPRHPVLSALAGDPSTNQHDVCAEYLLVSTSVIFRIQAKRSEILMIPGEVVSYRAGRGKLTLRRDDDQGELEATVLCMRSATATGDACGMKQTDFPQEKTITHTSIP